MKSQEKMTKMPKTCVCVRDMYELLIRPVIQKHRFVKDRVYELESEGFVVAERPMGPGGVGQIREMKDHFRVQIGYGKGRSNYAKCVIVSKLD